MGVQSISVRTEQDLLADIDAAAKAQDRSRNWWINQALRSAIEEEKAWVAQVEAGLKAADEGDFASEEDVVATFERFAK